MSSKDFTWFGLKITYNQSVHIFIISLIGFILSLFFLINTVTNFFAFLTHVNSYIVPISNELILTEEIRVVSISIFLGMMIIISFFSMIRCKVISIKESSQPSSEITWFGFKISRKLAIQVFIVSLIGIFVSTSSLIVILYDHMDDVSHLGYHPGNNPTRDETIFILKMYMLPYLILFGLILMLSLYSIIQRIINSKYLSFLVRSSPRAIQIGKSTQYSTVAPLGYCPGCGEIRKGQEKHCSTCGYQIG